MRLLNHCQSLLRGHPLESDWRRPLVDGYGLDEVVAILRPVFRSEPSMLKIVAVRGAVSYLSRNTESLGLFLLAVGIELIDDGGNAAGKLLDPPRDFPTSLEPAAIALGADIAWKATTYKEMEDEPWQKICRTWSFHPSDSNCLRMLAWMVVTSLRAEAIGQVRPTLTQFGLPSELEAPGWYVDPMFKIGDRYWDGSDWTDRCRGLSTRGEVDRPLY